MTVSTYEIQQAIEKKYGYYDDEFWETVAYREYSDKSKPLNLPGVGEIFVEEVGNDRTVDSYGYNTGGSAWAIIRIGDQYFRKNGYVNSYGQPEYDGILYEVKRHEETVVVKSWKQA